jgi:hypothetical protein
VTEKIEEKRDQHVGRACMPTDPDAGLAEVRTVKLGEVVSADEFLPSVLDLITSMAPSSSPPICPLNTVIAWLEFPGAS